MNPVFDNGYAQLVQGHVLDVLAEMPEQSVHCIVTSPPYWGLRDYKIEPIVWGGDAGCEHEWSTQKQSYNKPFTYPDGAGEVKSLSMGYVEHGTTCRRCSAWRGSLGLEPLHDCLAWARGEPPCSTCYVCHMRTVAKALWRVLRKDGTMWLDLGDSYAGSSMIDGTNSFQPISVMFAKPYQIPSSLKPKDLCGVPWRVAMALQADSWWLRSDIIWHKLNPMPESVTDRPTKSHEYVFLFSKSQQYYYDQQAIREPQSPLTLEVHKEGKRFHSQNLGVKREGEAGVVGQADTYFLPSGRNRRSVWPIASEPFEGAHFAVFPEKLVEPCILAGTSERGCCEKCGKPWERIVERPKAPATVYTNTRPCNDSLVRTGCYGGKGSGQEFQNWLNEHPVQTLGWQSTCTCNTDVISCTVLDPFVGSGTTAIVAQKLGRRCIGIDLQAMYLELAKKRLAEVPIPMPLET